MHERQKKFINILFETLKNQQYQFYLKTFHGLIPILTIAKTILTDIIPKNNKEHLEYKFSCYAVDIGERKHNKIMWYYTTGYKIDYEKKEVIFNEPFLSEYTRIDEIINYKTNPFIIKYTHALIELVIEVNTELFNFFENINID